MSFENKIKDSFLFGLVGGLFTLVFFFYLVTGIRMILISLTDNPAMLRPPFPQLLAMLLNVLLFRVLIINLKKENTGKGVLFITVLLTLAYFYIYNRMHK